MDGAGYDIFAAAEEAYPLAPGHKGRDTGIAAAADMRPSAGRLREQVLGAIEASAGLTADEVADRLDLSILTVRPRCSELAKLGRIVDSGIRRANASGKNAVVWRVPPQGDVSALRKAAT